MTTDNFNFKNFRIKKNHKKIKKDFELLIKENNTIIKSLSTFYKSSYTDKKIQKFKKYSNINSINSLIPYLKNDKKNNDDKINFILLKKIGKTSLPNKNKISLSNLKKLSNSIARY